MRVALLGVVLGLAFAATSAASEGKTADGEDISAGDRVYMLYFNDVTKKMGVIVIDVTETNKKNSKGKAYVRLGMGIGKVGWTRTDFHSDRFFLNANLYSNTDSAKKAVPKGKTIDEDCFNEAPRVIGK